MEKKNIITEELISLLRKGNAHVSLDDALQEIPPTNINMRPGELPYSIWELAAHIRITQWDIVQFCKDPKHQSPAWPEGYWPKEKNPTKKEWDKCLEQISIDREEMIGLINNSGDNLFEPFSHGDGQSLFREALVLADHNSYHTAEIIVVRRLLHIWHS
ncbi:MAG: DinB family protein [Ginsengibacter sp.]